MKYLLVYKHNKWEKETRMIEAKSLQELAVSLIRSKKYPTHVITNTELRKGSQRGEYQCFTPIRLNWKHEHIFSLITESEMKKAAERAKSLKNQIIELKNRLPN